MNMKIGLTIGAGLACWCVWANEFDALNFRGATDRRNPVGYAVGEPAVLTLTLENAPREMFDGKYAIDWCRWGDDGQRTKGRLPLDGKTPLQIRTTLDRPGGVFIEAYVVTAADGKKVLRDKPAKGTPRWEADGEKIQFIGSILFGTDQIRQARPEPADFDDFWARQKARLAAVPATVLERVEVTPNDKTLCRVWRVKVACAGPRPVTGYLRVPRDARPKSLKAICEFQGYGDYMQLPLGDTAERDIRFTVNAHGYDLGREPAYYEEFRDAARTKKYDYAFSPYQNEYPEGCYFNGMALRLMRAFDFVRTLPEWDGKRLEAEGGSQGGLQAMWAAGLVADLTESRPVVPWCADIGADACEGRFPPPWRIRYAPGLPYYDCVNHAKRATCRVAIMRAGLGDLACVPSGLAALYNCLRPEIRSINWVQGSKHGFVPPMPNQCVELPSGKTVAPYVGRDVFLGDKLPK